MIKPNNILLMESRSYTTTIEVVKSPMEIFECITKDVAKWWGGKDFTGRSTKINDEFLINHPGAHHSIQRLVEVIPNKKVIWLVTESKLDWLKKDQNEWTNTRMIFEIETNGDKAKLKFIHDGLIPQKECFNACSKGWSAVINDWLYTYITKGKAHF